MQNVFQKSVAAIILIVCMTVSTKVMAADEPVPYAALCQPDSYVTIRSEPDSHSAEEGHLYLGDTVQVEKTSKDKSGRLWGYCSDLSTEAGAGWIYMGYLGDAHVTLYSGGADALVTSRQRLAARRSIKGDVRKWLAHGDALTVYADDGTWAVTSEGFVKIEYLALDAVGKECE